MTTALYWDAQLQRLRHDLETKLYRGWEDDFNPKMIRKEPISILVLNRYGLGDGLVVGQLVISDSDVSAMPSRNARIWASCRMAVRMGYCA